MFVRIQNQPEFQRATMFGSTVALSAGLPDDTGREQLVQEGNILRPAAHRRRLQLIRKCRFLNEFGEVQPLNRTQGCGIFLFHTNCL
jgi:hypothetical protein